MRGVLDAAGVGLCVLDGDARVVLANDAWLRAFGLMADAATGRDLRELLTPPCLALRRALDEARAGKAVDLSLHRHVSEGRETWLEGRVAPIALEHGPGLLHTVVDVTERKRASDALHEREAQLRFSLANAAVGFTLMSPEGRFLEVNPAFCAITGYGMDELRKKGLLDLVHPDDRAPVVRQLERLRLGELSDFVVERRDVRKDGGLVWVRTSISVVRSTGGAPRWIVALVEDVTERRRAEEALRASEERFRRIFDRASIGVVLTRWDGSLEACNPAFARLIGYTAGELADLHFSKLLHPADAAENVELVRRLQAGELSSFELDGRYVRKDGTAVWVRKYVSLLGEGSGRSSMMVLVTDVTERKRNEEALREREQRFRVALGRAPVSVAVQDRELRFVWAYNQRTFRPEELIGKRDADVFRPDEAARLEVIKRRVLAEGVEHREQMWIERPGGPLFLDVTFSPILDETGAIVGVGSTTMDMTAMKRAEERLREDDERASAICEHAPVGVALVTLPDRVFVKVNEAFLRLHDLRRDDVLGQPAGSLLLLEEGERGRVIETLERDGSVHGLLVRRRSRGGETRLLAVDVDPLDVGGKPFLLAMVQDRGPVHTA